MVISRSAVHRGTSDPVRISLASARDSRPQLSGRMQRDAITDHPLLGGAAFQRCDTSAHLNAALAAEATES
jgi:hypothetical protein